VCAKRWILLLCAPLIVAGCGGGTTLSIATTTPPATANLNGNWLLVGTLPAVSTISAQGQTAGIAGTFNVSGSSISAAFSSSLVCVGQTGWGAATLGSGTVAPDGSFSVLLTPASAVLLGLNTTVDVAGVVPATGATTWTGTLTLANVNTATCPVPQSQPFTAVRIANLTGTYTGTTTLNSTSLTNPSSQTVQVILELTQGGSMGELAMTGTVKIQGGSCALNGTLTTASAFIAPEAALQVAMTDGSSVLLGGQVLDTSAAQLALSPALLNSSTCSGLISPATLLRQ
jgi:hypothetical protein